MSEHSDFNRNQVDDVTKRKHFKDSQFGEKKTYVDPYSGEVLHKDQSAAINKYGEKKYIKHTSDVDHVTPLKKIDERYSDNPFLTPKDIKIIGNQEANLRITSSTVNRQKGEKYNFEYIKNADIPVAGKMHMVLDQVTSEIAIQSKAVYLSTSNFSKSVKDNGLTSTIKSVDKSLGNNPEAIINGQRGVYFLVNSSREIVAVASGQKALAEAGVDTMKYVGGEIVETASNKLTNVAINALKLAPYSQAIYTAIYVGKIVGKNAIQYVNGEISAEQFWDNVGESGARMIGQAMGGAIGTALGGPLGAVIGSIIVSEVCGAVYKWAVKIKNMIKADAEELQRKLDYINSVASAASKAIRDEQDYLDSLIEQDTMLWNTVMTSAFDALEVGLMENNADKFTEGLSMISEYYGGKIQYKTSEEFDNAFLSDDFVIDL